MIDNMITNRTREQTDSLIINITQGIDNLIEKIKILIKIVQ